MKLELIKTKSQGVFVKDKESKQFDYRDLSNYFFNIQAYLDNLMEHINKPLKDCPHCEGKGVIIEDLVTYKK